MKDFKSLVLSCLMLTMLISCGTGKQATTSTTVKRPCSEFQNNKKYFRASQMGTSTNLSQSIKTAETNAKRSLAGMIETRMKDVTKIYTQDRDIADAREFSEKVETYTLALINQTLRELNKTCEVSEKRNPDKEGKVYYDSYISFECSKDVIYNGINKTLSNDQKLRQDYDEMKFKKVFDEEMAKLAYNTGDF